MNDWHRLSKSFGELPRRHPFLEEHARLMRALLSLLQGDTRLEEVEAGISLSTLTLKQRGSVHWVAVATRGTRYTVAIMDALESAERDFVQVKPDDVIPTIFEYLEKVRR